MNERLAYQVAALAGIAGAFFLTAFGFAAIRGIAIWSAGGNMQPNAAPVPNANATTKPAQLNKHQQLFVRMITPVVMPPDLVATIAEKDPQLSAWLDAWQKDHVGIGGQYSQRLLPLLNSTPLGAGDLWRLARQVDRGGDGVSSSMLAATAVRHAKNEIDLRVVRIDASYIHELSNLQHLLELGAGMDSEALEIWAHLILNAPQRTKTTDMVDSARLGLIEAKEAQGNLTEASRLLNEFKGEVASRKEEISEVNGNKRDFILGNIAMNQGLYEEALSDYQAVPHVDSDDAILAMKQSAFALAHLGRLEDAKHRIAEFLVRYHYDEDANGQYTGEWGDELASQIARIAPVNQNVTFPGS